MTLALSVKPGFADSDQTADAADEGMPAAHEISAEYDTTGSDADR